MSTFRDENVRYLRPLWLRALAVYALLIGILAYSFLNWPGSLGGAWPIGVGVAAGLGVVVARRIRRKGKVDQAMQSASADAAARTLFGDYINMPGRAVVPLVVTGTAQVHVIYGNFERAQEMLAAYPWNKEPPFIRGDHDFVLAVMEHVRGNHAAALALRDAMMPLMEIPRIIPGAARLGRSLAFLEAMGKVLAHDDRQAAEILGDAKLTRSSRLQRGVAAWALATAHARWGDREAADRWLAESRRILPHAYGLGVPRPAGSAPVSTARDATNPYAAPSAEAINEAPFEARPGKPTFYRRYKVVIVCMWALVLLAAHTYLSCIERAS
ncbi:MAG: hypothetical protein ACAI38_11205 [Myxococcota bacterium]